MLEKKDIKSIYATVQKEPQTVQDLAKLLDKSWLTAERYVQKLIEQDGLIGVKTFRGGTRGALKIVYWNQLSTQQTAIEKRIAEQIQSGNHKSDFSPSTIYQFAKNRKMFSINEAEYAKKKNFESLKKLLLSTDEEILMFSGNLSFIKVTDGTQTILDVIEQLASRGIRIKVLCRVELPGLDNIKKVLAINERIGEDLISIRHSVHPLRADVIDTKMLSMAESLDPNIYPKNELKKHMRIIYQMKDEEWITFMQKIFWDMYRGSIDAEKRLEFLNDL